MIRQGEVLKRDQWLKQAKDIITEYQKRTLTMMPGQPADDPPSPCRNQTLKGVSSPIFREEPA